MKIALPLISSLALVLGGVPKDRFDPCIFIDCTKFTTTKPTTKAATPKTTHGNAPKSEELIKIKTKLVRAFLIYFLFQDRISLSIFQDELDAKMTDFAAKDASLEDKDKELASNIVNIFYLISSFFDQTQL